MRLCANRVTRPGRLTGGGGGEYPLQDGFGWTNGVTLKMLDLICPKEQPCDNVHRHLFLPVVL
ncbi:trehalase family glycosidase [Escherichia sp. HC-CC]